MNIMVLGASGMFGRKTVLHMLQDEKIENVVSVDIAPPPAWALKQYEPWKEKFHYIRGTVADLEDILNASKLVKIDGIVNWAFVMSLQDLNTNPRLSTKVNVLGMCNAFEAARLIDAKRVVYASSMTVYGPADLYGDEVPEDVILSPNSTYAVAKVYAEIIAAQYHEQYGINFTGVRPTIGYGHGGKSPAQMWSDMPSMAATGQPYRMETDGNMSMSLVTADDLAIFTTMLMKAESSPRPAYNVGTPLVNFRDLAEVVKKYIPDAVIEFGDKSSPMGMGKPLNVTSKAAKEDFGFECMSLDEGIKIHINDARMEAGLEPLTF
ncbi:MAG: NAD(P)-dependent oxidoreductase [Dehalococcoidales bacterium]|nr:NAD(P)-dependent oxidoreductase [Dehalococcoidales bacterium]